MIRNTSAAVLAIILMGSACFAANPPANPPASPRPEAVAPSCAGASFFTSTSCFNNAFFKHEARKAQSRQNPPPKHSDNTSIDLFARALTGGARTGGMRVFCPARAPQQSVGLFLLSVPVQPIRRAADNAVLRSPVLSMLFSRSPPLRWTTPTI